MEAFLADETPAAYRRVVDRLLESQHFGERWGRHWLDVVRFAESSGGGRTLLFPEAWRYRDYVVESFNRDLPYNEFLVQQLAGDLIESDDWEQQTRNLAATAFLLLGPTNYELQDKEVLEMDIIDEQIDTMGKAFLGMTLGCARCHDHKFDPIPATDYYALAGILKSTKSVVHSNVSKWNTAPIPVPPEEAAVFRRHEESVADLQRKLEEATRLWIEAGGQPKKGSTVPSIDPGKLPGIVVDDADAETTGRWKESTSIGGYVGSRYLHDESKQRGSKRVTYRATIPSSGRYEVFANYTPSSNRSKRVPYHVHHQAGTTTVRVNQKVAADDLGSLKSAGASIPLIRSPILAS